MKNSMKVLVLALMVLGLGTVAFAQPAPCNSNGGGGTSGLDCFTISNTIETGLNGDLMAVTPDGEALADASVVYDSNGSLYTAALSMIPNSGGGRNGGGFNPANGLTTQFNGTGVANAFGYGSGPFMFAIGSPGNVPQGVPGGPEGPTPPGGGTVASTPTNEFQQIDQIVGKYTASSGFAQNFFTAVQRPALATNNNMSSGLFTLEQGDELEGTNPNAQTQVFKTQNLFKNGVTLDPDNMQLVQQDIAGVGPFSSCMNCFPGNVIGVTGDTPLGVYPNGEQGGAQVLYNSTVSLSPTGFTADSVTHPGP